MAGAESRQQRGGFKEQGSSSGSGSGPEPETRQPFRGDQRIADSRNPPFRGDVLPEHYESLLALTLEARAGRIAEGMRGRRRYPVGLQKDAEGWWSVEHCFSSFGAGLEIVRVLLLGGDDAFVVGAEVVDLKRPEVPARSPFGPGELTSGLALPRWLFGTDARRVDLVEPFAEWKLGETVRFRTTGEVEAGALVCRRKEGVR